MNRRFKAGDQFALCGVEYRVTKGHKGDDDLRIEWRQNGNWRPVELDHVFLIVDMICENEDVLYPRPRFQGGEYTMRFIKMARTAGWYAARNRLQQERANKAEQSQLFDSRSL